MSSWEDADSYLEALGSTIATPTVNTKSSAKDSLNLIKQFSASDINLLDGFDEMMSPRMNKNHAFLKRNSSVDSTSFLQTLMDPLYFESLSQTNNMIGSTATPTAFASFSPATNKRKMTPKTARTASRRMIDGGNNSSGTTNTVVEKKMMTTVAKKKDGSIKKVSVGSTFVNKQGKVIRGKPCQSAGCFNRAQSRGFCKRCGGGARCVAPGCTKSSQGGGFCRSHGGGKKCAFEGCEKGQQRNSFCFQHGAARACKTAGCTKKERSHGLCSTCSATALKK